MLYRTSRSNWIRLISLALPHLKNSEEVWAAATAESPLPPFALKSGHIIHHAPEDEPEFLFYEQFVVDSYLPAWFYSPKPQDVVLDCGANMGMFAIRLAVSAPGITVHCFEPAAAARSRLHANIAANSLFGHTSIHPFAIAGHCGSVALYHTWASGHRSIFHYDRVLSGHAEECECVDLNRAVEICNSDRIDLLKIDVEGAEIEILEPASFETLSAVKRIVVEYHDHIRPDSSRRVLQRLKGCNFEKIVAVPPVSADNSSGLIFASRSSRRSPRDAGEGKRRVRAILRWKAADLRVPLAIPAKQPPRT